MKKTFFIVLGVLLVVVVIWAIQPRPLPVDIVSVSKGEFESVLVEDGMTRIQNLFVVSSPVDGVLPRVTWDPGDFVKKGQKLLTIQWDQARPLFAPSDGEILRVYTKDKGFITKGKPILEIGNTEDLEIIVDILTSNAVSVKVGQVVRIENWGGDKPLLGEVDSLEPSGFTKVSALGVEEQRVNVHVKLTSPLEQWKNLGDRFRVECHIVTQKLSDVLLVPTGSLFQVDGQWQVFQYKDGKALLTNVNLGEKGPLQTVVSSGLIEGDLVVNYPGDRIQEGTQLMDRKKL